MDNLSQSKLGFVVDGNQKPVEASFNKNISEEELRKILFSRVKIRSIASYKGEDLIKISIEEYILSPIKKLDAYT